MWARLAIFSLLVSVGLIQNEPTTASEREDVFVWSLYRNSPIDKTMKIHVATFDSIEAGNFEANFEYNKENCETASKVFGGQFGVKADYWCEQGRFKKKK